jgi:hypothetical protein
MSSETERSGSIEKMCRGPGCNTTRELAGLLSFERRPRNVKEVPNFQTAEGLNTARPCYCRTASQWVRAKMRLAGTAFTCKPATPPEQMLHPKSLKRNSGLIMALPQACSRKERLPPAMNVDQRSCPLNPWLGANNRSGRLNKWGGAAGLRVSLQPWHSFLHRFAEVASMSWVLPCAVFESRARA